jgi:phenylalanyl-tRNA synthetase beta chain
MKVTYSWLKEFVDVRLAPEVLGERLTMAGLSVAALDRVGDDWVYDIEVTSNRPDWLSVRGIAREVAAITGAKLKKASKGEGRRKKEEKTKTAASFLLSIENPKDCPLYCGTLIAGVKVGPSPQEIVRRLEALGVRPVNNVVDITNICMLECGQPLHVFDFDKLARSSIIVRRAKAGEKLVLLDGAEKNLTKDVLVIADAAQPVAIAGVMGGHDAEVTAATKNILLESAVFDSVVVRRGARILGVATDASVRFERGVDAAATKTASDRAAEMILDVAGGEISAAKMAGHQNPGKNKKLLFSLREARESLGLALPTAKTKNILINLGFGVRPKKGDVFEVTVPAARRDVKIKEDIVEEVARSVGYDRIPLTAPRIKPFVYEAPAIQRVVTVARKFLVAAGCKEAVTYSLVSDDDYKRSLIDGAGEALALVNPLSVDARLLRI